MSLSTVSGEASRACSPLQAPAGSAAESIPVLLSQSAYAILLLAAAHDGVSPEELVTRLVCQHAQRIGISALGDLSAVPDFERASAQRSRRGGPG